MDRFDEITLQDIWRGLFNEGKFTAHTHLWFEAVKRFLTYKGAELIERDTIKKEQFILAKGLSQEYFKALKEAAHAEPTLTDSDRLMTLVIASGRHREQAVEAVLEEHVILSREYDESKCKEGYCA